MTVRSVRRRTHAEKLIGRKAGGAQEDVALSYVRVPRPLRRLLLDLTALNATPS
jgi:hypothetical protein